MWAWLARLVATAILLSGSAATASPSEEVGSAIWAGRASFVSSSYGPLYLALPESTRGTRARIAGPGGAVVRSSTDVGPDQSVFPDRVADLSYQDFETVCGPRAHERGIGTCAVTVEILSGGGPQPTPPATDV